MNIFIFYVLDYYFNDKYDIRYSLYKSFNDKDDLINENDEINSSFNFSIDLLRVKKDLEETELNERFVIVDSNFSGIERN